MAGVGSNIKRTLRAFGIKPSSRCGCTELQKRWDEWGCKKCEEKREEIISDLAEKARKYGFPFSEKAARIIVWKAIRDCFKGQK